MPKKLRLILPKKTGPPEKNRLVIGLIMADSDTAQKGWGLGLTLVKGITEADGGKVNVSRSYHPGATFAVSLPAESKPRL